MIRFNPSYIEMLGAAKSLLPTLQGRTNLFGVTIVTRGIEATERFHFGGSLTSKCTAV